MLCGGKALNCCILIQKIAQRGVALYSKCHEKINYYAGGTSSRETQWFLYKAHKWKRSFIHDIRTHLELFFNKQWQAMHGLLFLCYYLKYLRKLFISLWFYYYIREQVNYYLLGSLLVGKFLMDIIPWQERYD